VVAVTGLRNRKKQDTRHRILTAAAELFASVGLEATTVEEIAATANVSVGTVYNYFGTKNALLLAGVEEDTQAMVELGAEVLRRPGTNPVKAVQRLLGVYIVDFISWDRALLREVTGAMFQRSSDQAMAVELVRLDELLLEQLVDLLSGFRDRGRIAPDVTPLDAGLLLYSALMMQLFMYLSIEGLDGETLRRQVDQQVELAFHGLAPS